jgi:predicted MFS family arabinose efflux permease
MLAALDPWFVVLPVLLILAGVSKNISNTSANSVLQTTAPRQLLGQTVALHMLAIRGGVSLGSLFTGMSVSLFGVRQALIINGILAIVAQLLLSRGFWSDLSRDAD